MRMTFATLALLGAVAAAPAAIAAEPEAVPVVAEAGFTAPQAQTADEDVLIAAHRSADQIELSQSAGRMEGDMSVGTYMLFVLLGLGLAAVL